MNEDLLSPQDFEKVKNYLKDVPWRDMQLRPQTTLIRHKTTNRCPLQVLTEQDNNYTSEASDRLGIPESKLRRVIWSAADFDLLGTGQASVRMLAKIAGAQ